MSPLALDWIVEPPPAVDLLVRLTVLLAIGWLAHAALWRANPRWRMLLWRAMTVGLIAVPVAMAIAPGVPVRIERPAGTAPAPAGSEILANLSETAVEPPTATYTGSRLLAAAGKWAATVGAGLWLAVVALAGLRFWIGRRRAAAVLERSAPVAEEIAAECAAIAGRLGCGRAVEARMAAGLTTPLLTGLRRPKLLLPVEVCGPSYRIERPGIVVHEFSHLLSNDLFWGHLLYGVGAVLWFHPLAWRMREGHALACEQVSDAVSAAFIGDVRAYSRTLARVAVELVACPIAGGGIPMARVSEIQHRLERLKERVFAAPPRRSRVALGGVGLALCIGLLGVLRLAWAADDGADALARRDPLRDLAGPAAESPSAWAKPVRVTVAQGAPAAVRNLDVWNWAGGTMKYEIAALPPALFEVVPASGETSGEVNRHYVRFKTSGLRPGIHTGRLIILSNAPNAPVTIPVELVVTSAGTGL